MRELIATICLGVVILAIPVAIFGVALCLFPMIDAEEGYSASVGRFFLGVAAVMIVPSLAWLFWGNRKA